MITLIGKLTLLFFFLWPYVAIDENFSGFIYIFYFVFGFFFVMLNSLFSWIYIYNIQPASDELYTVNLYCYNRRVFYYYYIFFVLFCFIALVYIFRLLVCFNCSSLLSTWCIPPETIFKKKDYILINKLY